MALTVLSAEELAINSVDALGLDKSTTGLMSHEGLAASIRRAASFLCPTAPGSLVRAVVEVLSGLPGFNEETQQELEREIELLVSYGDLVELSRNEDLGNRRRIFLGPPGFVRRASDTCLLVGIRPEGAPLLREEFLRSIEYEGHVRLLRASASISLDEVFESNGLLELRPEHWLQAPREVPPGELIAFYDARLTVARRFYGIEGVRLVDPLSKTTYYKGRWRTPGSRDDGRFVARRPQAFGADLWCFVEIQRGEVIKLIDLPLQSALAASADEAWRLQAAIDATNGRPQVVRIRPGSQPATVVLDFFSPAPGWLQRRLDFLGTPILGGRGALFSYALRSDEVDEELEFLMKMMWMSTEGGTEARTYD